MTNADKFKEVFGIYATELWAKTEKDFLEWINEDVPDTDVGDMISRQAAMHLKDLHGAIEDGILYVPLLEVINHLEALPSARRNGKWIDQKGGGCCCSECGKYALDEIDGNYIHVAFKSSYCPNCGAEMKGESDDKIH